MLNTRSIVKPMKQKRKGKYFKIGFQRKALITTPRFGNIEKVRRVRTSADSGASIATIIAKIGGKLREELTGQAHKQEHNLQPIKRKRPASSGAKKSHLLRTICNHISLQVTFIYIAKYPSWGANFDQLRGAWQLRLRNTSCQFLSKSVRNCDLQSTPGRTERL